MRGWWLALPLCLAVATAAAAEPQQAWSVTDESLDAAPAGSHQARAAIHRGDLLVALRCQDAAGRRGETLLIGATRFVRPKAHLTFTLTIDGGAPLAIEFQRETDYRFAAVAPPAVIDGLMSGGTLTLGGPDFAGEPASVPLTGSRAALEEAFALCGYEPPAAD